MKNRRNFFFYGFYILLGVTLVALGVAEVIDEFWSGMGGGLLGVGLVRLIWMLRMHKDETYREKVETEVKDERNAFIRNKAWAWAGYLFVLIMAVSAIVFYLLGQDILSVAAGCAVCMLVLLYWISYLILRKKY